ncbi:acyl-CoA dehydrogenase family protein, partial [uncultured Aurantimicrobium sp.]|uniref:acyl-CoA dehydrogenase family protein n=1 Tax=uncultured Aurantimicrobium sp. TaxID=1705357 RepID=UPI00262F5196
MSTNAFPDVSVMDDVFDLHALLQPDEIEWAMKARTFAQTKIRPVIEDDFDKKFFRKELIPQIAAEGFLGMHLKGYGCAGASAVSYGLVCLEFEAVDSGWRTFISVMGSLAMSAIYKYGTEEQKNHWLPQMAKGEKLGCFGLTEPQGGSDPANMLTTAKKVGDTWVINGAKRWIGLATLADICIVWAMTDEGVRGFIVPTDTPGFTATAIDGKLSMRASIQCDIELTNVILPADALLPNAKGLSGPFGCLNEARYGIIWGAMGAARACLDVAITRSKERDVFGKPIGSFQLTQAKLADMTLEYEKGVLLALHIGRQKDAGTLNIAQISVGKLNSVREALKIAREARTILGGDGITGEFPVMRHMA